MSKPNKKTLSAIAVLAILSSSTYAAEKLDVKIIGRQDNGGTYTYIVPGYSDSNSTTNVNCHGSVNYANCIGSTTTTGSSTPPRTWSYEVRGATLSLQLPDGRIAVVNCESKANWTDFSKMNQVHRSCRIPLVNNIRAEFDGDKATLRWSVSIDGKKMQSETYKILAVLDKP